MLSQPQLNSNHKQHNLTYIQLSLTWKLVCISAAGPPYKHGCSRQTQNFGQGRIDIDMSNVYPSKHNYLDGVNYPLLSYCLVLFGLYGSVGLGVAKKGIIKL